MSYYINIYSMMYGYILYNYICLTYISNKQNLQIAPTSSSKTLVSFHPSFPGARSGVVSNRCLVWEVRDFDWQVGSWENPERLVIFGKGIYPPKCPKHSGWQNGCFRVLRVIFVVDDGGFGWG